MDPVTIRLNKALRGIGTVELARRAGVSRVTAYRWEHGVPYVSQETAARLTRALLEQNGVQDVSAQKIGR